MSKQSRTGFAIASLLGAAGIVGFYFYQQLPAPDKDQDMLAPLPEQMVTTDPAAIKRLSNTFDAIANANLRHCARTGFGEAYARTAQKRLAEYLHPDQLDFMDAQSWNAALAILVSKNVSVTVNPLLPDQFKTDRALAWFYHDAVTGGRGIVLNNNGLNMLENRQVIAGFIVNLANKTGFEMPGQQMILTKTLGKSPAEYPVIRVALGSTVKNWQPRAMPCLGMYMDAPVAPTEPIEVFETPEIITLTPLPQSEPASAPEIPASAASSPAPS